MSIAPNVLLVTKDRVRWGRPLSEAVGLRVMALMDFVAVDLGNGSVDVIKNRWDGKFGVMPIEAFELRVSYWRQLVNGQG